MGNIYYHVADLEKDIMVGANFPLPPCRVFDEPIRKKTEVCLEEYRKRVCSESFSRYVALFISKTMEQAQIWAQRKFGHGNVCYIYTLEYGGKIEWHRADYFDRLFGIFSKDGTPANLRHITQPEDAAGLYWEAVGEPVDDKFDYEGLIYEEPFVIQKDKFVVP